MTVDEIFSYVRKELPQREGIYGTWRGSATLASSLANQAVTYGNAGDKKEAKDCLRRTVLHAILAIVELERAKNPSIWGTE